MHEQRIVELEQQLAAANQAVAALTQTNADLSRQVADAEGRNKKLKRSARNGESVLKDQLAAAQNRRG
jgi:phage shock protein A